MKVGARARAARGSTGRPAVIVPLQGRAQPQALQAWPRSAELEEPAAELAQPTAASKARRSAQPAIAPHEPGRMLLLVLAHRW